MGGGHLSRPDFGMPQPDPAHPLTEFYLLLQHTLDRAGVFALPALYAGFQAPARRIYPDEAADYLTLSETEQEGMTRLLAPSRLQLLYSSLHVAPDGTPAALLLTEECSRSVCAVQLLPPFLWEEPLPPVPDTPSALTLTLTPPRWAAALRRRPAANAGCATRRPRPISPGGSHSSSGYTGNHRTIQKTWKNLSIDPPGRNNGNRSAVY